MTEALGPVAGMGSAPQHVGMSHPSQKATNGAARLLNELAPERQPATTRGRVLDVYAVAWSIRDVGDCGGEGSHL